MHITDNLSALENSDNERLHNIIVDVFDVVLEGLPVFPPHDISQIEPQLLLKVGAPFQSADRVFVSADSIHLGPSLEIFHGNSFFQPETSLISS